MPRQRLNVLFLAHLFPWPLNFGARQRVFHLVRGIAAGHEVSVVALASNTPANDETEFIAQSGCARVSVVPPDAVNATGAKERRLLARVADKARSLDARLRSPLPPFVRDFWSSELVTVLDQIKGRETIDVVFATRSWMAEHARAAGFPRIIVDVDDLMSKMSWQRASSSGWHRRKPIELFDAAKNERYERSLPQRFMHVVVAKSEDRDFFAPADRERVSVVPNGITIPAAPSPEPAAANALLFIGTLGYGPNIDAIRWFASEVLPLIWNENADVRFVVAGYGSAEAVAEGLRDPRCTVHESPPDLGPLYDAASVVVTPVRMGGGTRIKILEALGHGRAVVSTSFAAEGLGLRGGIDLEFADTPVEFAARCLDLLRNDQRRRILSSEGRAHVTGKFDWRPIELALPKLVSEAATGAVSSDAR
ncbi:MAG TPA: glycosyltransferase [Tepidisphaeraceae bacterium]|nr:glycosyltransferase [Tepidisphaeraceae bacterium]